MNNDHLISENNRPVDSCSFSIETYFRSLQDMCGNILGSSFTGTNSGLISTSFQFSHELEVWCEILQNKRESELIKVASIEYMFGLFGLIQGHYRHAFKELRLVLELILQAVYLSMNELLLREWFDNRLDTVWSAIIDEHNGIFSDRVVKAFYPDLKNHIKHYRGLAQGVYRECSECVHGNIPKCVPLQLTLAFDQDIFNLWHLKAETVSLVTNFALSLRYLMDLKENDRLKLESFLSDSLGHISEIRKFLGGPTKA